MKEESILFQHFENVMNAGLDQWFRWLYNLMDHGESGPNRIFVRTSNPEEYAYDSPRNRAGTGTRLGRQQAANCSLPERWECYRSGAPSTATPSPFAALHVAMGARTICDQIRDAQAASVNSALYGGGVEQPISKPAALSLEANMSLDKFAGA